MNAFLRAPFWPAASCGASLRWYSSRCARAATLCGRMSMRSLDGLAQSGLVEWAMALPSKPFARLSYTCTCRKRCAAATPARVVMYRTGTSPPWRLRTAQVCHLSACTAGRLLRAGTLPLSRLSRSGSLAGLVDTEDEHQGWTLTVGPFEHLGTERPVCGDRGLLPFSPA